MIRQLVALSEYCFSEKGEGEKKKLNVKYVLTNNLKNNSEIAEVLLDDLVDACVKNNSRK